jgi:putative transposase
VRFLFIEAEEACYPIARLCRALAVSRAGYYAWHRRPPSQRRRDDVRLRLELRAAFRVHRKAYGSPRLYREVRRVVPGVGRRRTARLMREEGLVARPTPRPYRREQAKTVQKVRNVLKRQFTQDAPNRAWVGDITYLATSSGWVYLAVILDLFSRRVVGWAVSMVPSTAVALKALRRAVERRRPRSKLLMHTDQGVQYTSTEYQRELAARGLTPSMSRRGNCWDNAVVESFFGTLKTEWTNNHRYRGLDDSEASLHDYIEKFYNPERQHSALGYVSPMEFERQSKSA